MRGAHLMRGANLKGAATTLMARRSTESHVINLKVAEPTLKARRPLESRADHLKLWATSR